MKDPDELMDAYLHGDLTPEEEQRFQDWLSADLENLRHFVRETHVHKAIRDCLRSAQFEEAAVDTKETSAFLLQIENEARSRILPLKRGLFAPWIPWAAAACLALSVGGYFLVSRKPPAMATLLEKQATVTVERNQRILQSKRSESLRAGDTIRVGNGGSGVIRYADATQLEIGANSVLTLQPGHLGKSVELRHGSLSADVAKQPAGQPMVFATPTAEATVLGTRLLIAANAHSTRLEVQEGRVTLKRASDQASVEVAAGQVAVAADGVVLKSRPLMAKVDLNTPADESLIPSSTGPITLYSNDMETAATYKSGTLVTIPAPHGGLKSEQIPVDHVLQASGFGVRNFPLPASVSNLTYRVWLTDGNHATQQYRLLVRFKNPATGAVTGSYFTPWTGAGTTWTQFSGDFTTAANTSIAAGYTQLNAIWLQAWNSGGATPYVPYYADDVLVTYQ